MLSIASRLLFHWVTPFIYKNSKRTLSEGDLLPIKEHQQAEKLTAEFEALYAKPEWQKRSFLWIVLWLYRRDLRFVFLLTIPFLFVTLGSPFFLRLLIQTLQGVAEIKDSLPIEVLTGIGFSPRQSQALTYAAALLMCTLTTTFIIHHIFYRQLMMSLCFNATFVSTVYRKSLRLSRDALQRIGSGFIVNLISVDIFRISNLLNLAHILWFQPVLIICVLVMLYQLIGPPAIAGVIVMVVVLACGVWSTRVQSRLRRRTTKLRDRRVGLTSEILTHIRGVKISRREEELQKRIAVFRNEELELTKKILLLLNVTMFASASAPVLAMGAMFILVVQKGGSLDPAQIFPSLSLLLTLRFALNVLPDMMLNLMDSRISARRLRGFFAEPEFSARSKSILPPGSIELRDARFLWGADTPAIGIPTFSAKPGEFIAVVGAVGAGKSAFILALLNELERKSGGADVSGEISYVAQQPWLMSETIRNNILCNQPFDTERYERAISLSELKTDLYLFPGGDQVEIGERGITLSGGQRQRLALARAYYRVADIVLLDDPLSALDSSVAGKVFDNLIRGAWNHTTRILVTHRLEYAFNADRVIVIEDGTISAEGTIENVMNVNSAAKALFIAHRDTALSGGSVAHGVADDSKPTDVDLVQKAVALEERQEGAVDRAVVLQYMKLFVPGALCLLLFGLFVGRQTFSVGLDLWWAFSTTAKDRSVSDFILGFLVLSLFVCLLNFSRSFFMLRRGLIAGQGAHERLLRGVLRAPMRFFESNPTGRILNRFSRDLESVDAVLPRSLFDVFVCCFDGLATILIVTVLQPLSAIVIVPVLWLYARLQSVFRPTSREVQRLESVSRSPIFAYLSESLRGVDTLRSLHVIEPFQKKFSKIIDINSNAYYSVVATNRWLGIRLEVLGAAITLVSAVAVCFFVHDELGAALGGFALTYSMTITGSMNWFVRMLTQSENNLTSFERIEHYANQPSERWEGEEPPATWPESGAISFNGVSVRYRPELPRVLSDISLSVKAGERIGLVGRTGSGKSTLVQVLFRLLELEQGAIIIDGKNIGTMSLAALRDALTMIPQEPVLFSGTIRSNLDPHSTFSDDELLSALERVELKQFISESPEGLLSAVIEGGQNFSAGQRQLLCLAQALLRKTRILILDEATANVDPKSDQAIQNTIRREFGNATQLIIAHRLGTVMDCDRIAILEFGRVVRCGSPHELLASGERELSQALEV